MERNELIQNLKSIPIQKNMKSTFFEMEAFEKIQTGKIIFDDEKKKDNAELIKENKAFKIRFASNSNYQKYSEHISSIKFEIDNTIYYSDDSLITNMSFTFPITYGISISTLYKGNKSNFYRIALPLEKELDLVRLFNNHNFCYNESGCSSELIKTYINGNEFHIYELPHNRDEKYLFIDCLAIIDYDSFYNQIVCILCALGVLTGYFVEEECFIFSASDDKFEIIEYVEFRSLRKSIISPYQILPTNPYMFFLSEIASTKHNLMAHINTDVFTKLVNKINLSLPFENTLFVFLEALSYPLDTQPLCLSVVLEGLTNYVKDNNEEKFLPIKDKNIAKRLKEEMLSLLNNYNSDFSDDGKEVMEKKIADINSPTNRGKFEKAIKELGLNLTDYEEETLLNRNTYLHGRIDLKTEHFKIKINSPEYMKQFFSSQILIRLLYKMILKIIGYEGNIVNILKYNEDTFESIKSEPMLIKV